MGLVGRVVVSRFAPVADPHDAAETSSYVDAVQLLAAAEPFAVAAPCVVVVRPGLRQPFK